MRFRMPWRGSASAQLLAGGVWLLVGVVGLVVAEETFLIGGGQPEEIRAARTASELAVWIAGAHTAVGLGQWLAGVRWWAWLPATLVPALAGVEQARHPELTLSALVIWFLGIPVVVGLIALSSARSRRSNGGMQATGEGEGEGLAG